MSRANTIWRLPGERTKNGEASSLILNNLAIAVLVEVAGAYWLMWVVRHAMPATAALRTGEFATIRLRLLKVAARVIETASRVRVAFASACPDAALFRSVALNLRGAGP